MKKKKSKVADDRRNDYLNDGFLLYNTYIKKNLCRQIYFHSFSICSRNSRLRLRSTICLNFSGVTSTPNFSW
jgi:hypothetical protein